MSKALELPKFTSKSILKRSGGKLEAKNCFQTLSAKFSFAFYVLFNSFNKNSYIFMGIALSF